MTYVVRTWIEDKMIRREFKYKKSALKFATKLSDEGFTVDFIEYDENNQLVSESRI